MQRAIVVSPWLLLGAAALVAAQDEGEVQTFVSIEVREGGGVLTLSGGLRYGVPAEVYTRHVDLWLELERGDKVRVTLDPQGQLATIARVAGGATTPDAPDTAAGRHVIEGVFQRFETHAGRYWVVIDGQRYTVPDEVYAARKNAQILQFHQGRSVRAVIEKGQLVEIAKGGDAGEIDPALWDLIQRSRRGDIVTVRGNVYRFSRHTLTDVELVPRLPDGSYAGKSVFELKDLDAHGFINLAALDRESAGTTTPQAPDQVDLDVFARQDVRVGDTVAIGLDSGQIVALTDEEVRLRVWRNEAWGPERAWPRAEVEAVRRYSLTSQQTLLLEEGGEARLRVHRSRVGSRRGLTFEVQLSHDVAEAVLVGATLRFHLGGLGLEPGTAGEVSQELTVPDLFAGQQVTLEHTAGPDHMDGWVALEVQPQDLVAVTSQEAKPHILAAIDRERGPDLLGQVYEAAGRNGEEGLVRLLLDRALDPPQTEEIPREVQRDLAIAGLRASGAAAPAIIINDLYFADRNLKRTLLERGDLRQEPLSRFDINPVAYKRGLIRVLGRLPGGLSGETGERLFDLYLRREDLSEAIEDAFMTNPEEAIECLLDVATGVTSAATPEQQLRADRAAQLLQALGDQVLDALFSVLRAREIQGVATLQQARASAADPSQVVNEALRLLIDDAIGRRRAALDRQVEEARRLESEQDLQGALRELRAVLREDPNHLGASELVPAILVRHGEQLLRSGARGEAAVLLEEAVERLPSPRKGQAKVPLGDLYLEAAKEEAEGVVIRAMPHDLAEKVRLARPGEAFQGEPEGRDWVRVQTGPEQTGFVRARLLSRAGEGRWTAANEVPFQAINQLLKKARELSPAVEAEADEVEGRMLAREAQAKYEAGDFAGALPLYEQARKLAPTDERLANEKWAWLSAYQGYLIALGGVLALAVGIGVMQVFARPRKVKFEGEFRHYGKDRAARERDLALGEEESVGDVP